MDFQYQPKGVVVPQPVYKATAQFNALPTICFVEGNTLGVNLGNALRKQVTNLANKDSRPKISETAKKVTIRINVSLATGRLMNLLITRLPSGLGMSHGPRWSTLSIIRTKEGLQLWESLLTTSPRSLMS